MRIQNLTSRLLLCTTLLATADMLAATRTWTGAAGTTVLNTGNNWSGSAAPGAADIGVFDGTVQTNVPFVWNASNWNGSGNTAASFLITNYPQAMVWNGANDLNVFLCISNIVISADSGPFTLNDGTVFAGTVFRSSGPVALINNSPSTATIGPLVNFNSSGGGAKTVTFGGSGNWVVDSPWAPAGQGNMSIRVDGTGANTLTLNAGILTGSGTSHNITNGTLVLTHGDALAAGGTQTLTIEGGGGVRRLTLTNNIWLNPAVANINIAGRTEVAGAANAAIQNYGENTVNGIVRFNATGGTNIGIFNQTGTLTLNGNGTTAITAANVTGDRWVNFGGSGTTLVQGNISNGSALLGLRVSSGTLVLGGANTHSGNTVIDGGVLTVANEQALPNSTVVVNGGILNVNAAAIYAPMLGGLAGTGTVTSQSGGSSLLSVGNNNATTTFSGVISDGAGTVALKKVGTGSLTLAGASTFSGGVTVASGTLFTSNSSGSATGTGAVTVNSGASLGGSGIVKGPVTWESGSFARLTLTPTTSVAGSNATALTVNGSLNLNDTPIIIDVAGSAPLGVGSYKLLTYTAAGSTGSFSTATPTFVGAGVSLGTASTITSVGGVVTLTVTFTGTVSTWTNDNDSTWATGANWSSNPYYPQVAGDSATLGVGSAFRTVTLNAPVSIGTIQFTNQNSFLIANGGNMLTLANPAGPAVISVQAGASNAIAAPMTLNADVTLMTTAGSSLTLSNNVTDNGSSRTLNLSGPGTVSLERNNTYGPGAGSVGTSVSGGVIQLGANAALGTGDLSVSSTSTIRMAGPLSVANNIVASAGATAIVDSDGNNVTLSGTVSGAGGLTKQSAGVLTLNSANYYAGNTVVNAGELRTAMSGAIPGGTGNGNVTVATNATLNLNGTSQVLNGLNGAGTVDSFSAGSMTLTLGESGAGGTFTGSIRNTAGTVALVKNGGGTQTLAGTNSYTGGTTINSGTLQIGNGGASGNLGSGPLVNNANLAFNLAGSNVFAGQITGLGTVTLANTNLSLWLTGNNTFTGNIQNNGGTLWITNSSALGIGPKTVIAVGNLASQFTQLRLAGNVNLDPSISFSLSYSGGVLINESGTNTIQGTIAMPNGGGNPLIVVSNGFLTLGGDISTVSGNNARTLTLDGPGDGLVSGNIYDGGPAASVTKNGSGTWTLTGAANSYSGATTVNGGTLLVNGSNAGAGAVTAASGAAFGGTGTIAGSVTWQAASRGVFIVNQSAGANTTPMSIWGNATLNDNPITVNIAGSAPLAVGSYVLMGATTITGAFSGAPVITGAGLAPNTFASVVTANNQVTLIVVPTSVWVHNGNGNWSTPGNWNSNPNIPDTAGEFATLGVGSSLTTVTLDSSMTVGGISFTNPNSFVVTSPINTLRLNNNGNTATISVTDGAANAIAAQVEAVENTVISVSSSNALSLSGNVSGTGTLTKGGEGVLSLSGSNSFNGMALTGGTLALGSTNALGSSMFTIRGGNLDSQVPNLVNRNNNPQTWSGSFGFLGSQNLDLGNGGVTLTANLTLGLSNSTLIVNGPIEGGFALTVTGTTNGTLVLGGNNTFTGLTALGGTIALGSDTALGTAATLQFTPTTGPGVTLRSKDSTPRTITNNVSVNAFDGPYILGGTGNLTFTGSIVSGNGQKRFTINNTTTFAGPVTDNGAPNGPIIIDGIGRLNLPIANSLTKTFQISGATVVLSDPMAFGSGPLVLNGGALDSTVPDMLLGASKAQTWSGSFGFAGTENLNLGTGAVGLTTNVTITVSNKVLTVGGAISGAFSITKAGAGRLVLSGANSYGDTLVTGGTLELAQATLRTNSNVSVSSGAALQLNFSSTNQVAGLVLNGVSQPAGVYKSDNSGGLITGPGALLVVPLGPTAPAVLTSTIAGNQLNLSWPAGQGWRLQAQTNSLSVGLSNNWVYITDGSVSSTNITVEQTAPAVFFRLVYP